MGDVQGAQEWAVSSQSGLQDSIDSQDEFVTITYARVLDALGRVQERNWLLVQLRDRVAAKGHVMARIEIDLLLAIAAQSEGDLDAALDRLLPALRAAEDAGMPRLVLDAGPRIGPLLARADRARSGAPDDPGSGFITQLRGQLADRRGSDRPSDQSGLIEPLTPREREVLQLIAAGRSNQAIAAELFLSIGSVKTHSSHLYGKLGVRGRTEAIARARSLGLIG
jgi:LuxR family maltose regulon positive regulatory protein